MRSVWSRRRWLAGTLAATLAALSGCGYTLRAPYSENIRTVYVPVFKSISFRRDLNLQLTEMVQDEIQRRTNFKLVSDPAQADSILEGTIQFVDKNMLLKNPNNLPRQILGSIMVTVRWTDTEGGIEKVKELPAVPVIENMSYYPEIGETSGLGMQKVLAKLAQDIVNMMEEPW